MHLESEKELKGFLHISSSSRASITLESEKELKADENAVLPKDNYKP